MHHCGEPRGAAREEAEATNAEGGRGEGCVEAVEAQRDEMTARKAIPKALLPLGYSSPPSYLPPPHSLSLSLSLSLSILAETNRIQRKCSHVYARAHTRYAHSRVRHRGTV